MKKILTVVAVLALLTANAQDKKQFTLSGNISNTTLTAQKVYINYRAGGQNILDSATVTDGKYTITGAVNEPGVSRLTVKYLPGADGRPVRTIGTRDMVTFFLSEGNLRVTSVDSFSNATVTGTRIQDDYAKLTALQKPFNEKGMALNEQYKKATEAKDEAAKKSIIDEFNTLDAEMKEQVLASFIKSNPQSAVSVYALTQYAGYDIAPAKIEPLIQALSPELKAMPGVKSMITRVELTKKTDIGQMAIDFTQNDTLGNPVKLSSLKGKYVLLDFWASWCVPCREENPNVVKAFQAYKTKGFHVLGVSLDQPGMKDRWIKAIHDDHLTWTHVSDLQYWNNEAARAYGIQAIPMNYLLDPQGKIIAKNIRGEELQQKLKELLP